MLKPPSICVCGIYVGDLLLSGSLEKIIILPIISTSRNAEREIPTSKCPTPAKKAKFFFPRKI
jgi:hypothetical protein